MKLTDDAKVWHLLWSNQAAILSAVLVAQSLLPQWQGIIPEKYLTAAGAVLATLSIILKHIQQPKAKAKLEVKNAKRDMVKD